MNRYIAERVCEPKNCTPHLRGVRTAHWMRLTYISYIEMRNCAKLP